VAKTPCGVGELVSRNARPWAGFLDSRGAGRLGALRGVPYGRIDVG
jgi:hypothetical protein